MQRIYTVKVSVEIYPVPVKNIELQINAHWVLHGGPNSFDKYFYSHSVYFLLLQFIK